MAHKQFSFKTATRQMVMRLLWVSLVCCAVAIMGPPQSADAILASVFEVDMPLQEESESPEIELVVRSTISQLFSPPRQTSRVFRSIRFEEMRKLRKLDRRLPMGHRLANSLRAPLLI